MTYWCKPCGSTMLPLGCSCYMGFGYQSLYSFFPRGYRDGYSKTHVICLMVIVTSPPPHHHHHHYFIPSSGPETAPLTPPSTPRGDPQNVVNMGGPPFCIEQLHGVDFRSLLYSTTVKPYTNTYSKNAKPCKVLFEFRGVKN